MRHDLRRRMLIAGALSIAGPGLATALGLLAGLEQGPGAVAVMLVGVAVVALAGLRSGLVAGALATVALDYFFLGPGHAFGSPPRDVATLVGFVVAAIAIPVVLHRRRAAARALRQALDERQRSLEALQASDERLRTIIRGTVDGIVVIDDHGTIELFNSAAERLFGYAADDVVGRNVSMLMPPPYRDEHDGYLAAYMRTGEAKVIGVGREVTGLRRDGTTFPFDLSISEIRADGRRLFTGVVRDLSERKLVEARQAAAVERERFLAEAGTALSSSLDYGKTLQELAELAIRSLADWCSIDVVTDDGRIESVAIAHVDPAKVGLARDLRLRYPPDPAEPTGLAAVIRSGRSELYPEISDELLMERTRDGEQLELARSLGLRSAMIVALVARGSILGAITFVVAESGRRYGADDLRLAEELARHAALSIDNARLHEAERAARRAAERAAETTARLQSVTAALSGAVTPEQVVEVVVGEGTRALEADAGAVFVLDPAADQFELLGQIGYPGELEEAWRRFSSRAPGPANEVIRSLEIVAVESPEELVRRWPELAEARERSGDAASIAAPVGVGNGKVGVIHFAFRAPRQLGERERSLVRTLASQCGQALERAHLYALERDAREAVEQSSRRAARLHAVTLALAPAVTAEEVGAVLVDQGRKALGASAAWVSILDQTGEELRLLAEEGYAASFAERYRTIPMSAPLAVVRAVETGEPSWFRSPEELPPGFSELHESQEATSSAALAILPLLSAGRAFGFVALRFRRPRAFAEDERRLLAALVGQCAEALGRARIYEREQAARRDAERAARRATELQLVTAALSEALTTERVVHVLLDQGLQALGAVAGSVGLVDEGGGSLAIVATRGLPAEPGAQAAGRALDRDDPGHESVRTLGPLWFESGRDLATRFPAIAGHGDFHAAAVVPLVRKGAAMGCVSLYFAHARTFGEEDKALLTALAGQCTQALERARLYEHEHTVAETLQRGLLPDHLPQLPGAALGARYAAGSPGLQVGGDWYDAFSLADGVVVLSVGDVVGRGVRAAATMGQLRNALRAYVLEGFGAAETLERLNRLAEDVADRFATVVVALFDPATGTLRFASAGHLPPLLVGPDGETSFVDGARSVPLGTLPEGGFSERALRLEPGSTLVLYTDGLIERRDEAISDGLDRLARVAADGPYDVQELLDHLIDSIGGELADDVAVLALRALPHGSDRFALTIPAKPSALASVRAELRRWLSDCGASPRELNDIVLACGEACSNAIEHSLSRSVEVAGHLEDGRIVVAVRDRGRWREPLPRPDRGLGLKLMGTLMDDVDLATEESGTEVRMQRRIGQEPAG